MLCYRFKMIAKGKYTGAFTCVNRQSKMVG